MRICKGRLFPASDLIWTSFFTSLYFKIIRIFEIFHFKFSLPFDIIVVVVVVNPHIVLTIPHITQKPKKPPPTLYTYIFYTYLILFIPLMFLEDDDLIGVYVCYVSMFWVPLKLYAFIWWDVWRRIETERDKQKRDECIRNKRFTITTTVIWRCGGGKRRRRIRRRKSIQNTHHIADGKTKRNKKGRQAGSQSEPGRRGRGD